MLCTHLFTTFNFTNKYTFKTDSKNLVKNLHLFIFYSIFRLCSSEVLTHIIQSVKNIDEFLCKMRERRNDL